MVAASREFRRDAEPLQHGRDLRSAAMHHHRIDRSLLQEHDVAGKSLCGFFRAHGVAAIFNDDGFLVILLHVRQRFRQDAGLIEGADIGHVGHETALVIPDVGPGSI
jgi:hypothetical protein